MCLEVRLRGITAQPALKHPAIPARRRKFSTSEVRLQEDSGPLDLEDLKVTVGYCWSVLVALLMLYVDG